MTAWDYDDVDMTEVDDETNTHLMGEAGAYSGHESTRQNAIHTVHIKREKVATVTGSRQNDISVDAPRNKPNDSVMSEASEDSYNDEAMWNESDSEEEISSINSQKQDCTETVCNRKSVMGVDRKQLKRMHMTEINTVLKDKDNQKNQGVVTKVSKQRSQYPEDAENSSDGETVDEETKQPLRRDENNVQVQVQTDSDDEWKKIAATGRSINGEYRTNNRGVNTNAWGTQGITKQSGKRLICTNTKKSNKVIVTTTNQNKANRELLENRGGNMIEERETLVTPLKVEFNLINTMEEFNIILAVGTLFNNLHLVDETLKVYNNDRTELVWDDGKILSEDEKFVQQFRMREQTFRNGNKKVTLHCTLETLHNINRIKFMEPVKSYITEHNIWLKPDYYSTKLVSSPGFFTMVHHKLTYKQDYAQSINNILSQIEVDGEDEAVQVWCRRTGQSDEISTKNIPSFHIENSVRKWGGLKVDILGVYCSQEDAKYLKYLLTVASAKGLITNGVFVPNGIHLVEGKEIMTDLLQEHANFLQNVTSIHLSGISRQAMNGSSPNDESNTCTLLKQCKGIWAIEPTHFTEKNGTWIIVLQKDSMAEVSQYIKNNLENIYRNRKGKIP